MSFVPTAPPAEALIVSHNLSAGHRRLIEIVGEWGVPALQRASTYLTNRGGRQAAISVGYYAICLVPNRFTISDFSIGIIGFEIESGQSD